MRQSPTAVRAPVLDRLGLARSDHFRWAGIDLADDSVALQYDLDGVGPLTERFTFSGVTLEDTPALRAALRLLHLVAGVSYLKATIPPRLDADATAAGAAGAALLTALVTDGLGEFAHVNGVDLREWFTVASAPHVVAPAGMEVPRGPLVPVGGGKDSIVTLEALRDLAPTLFAINPKGPIVRTLEAAGMPAITVRRELDPQLFELNDRGALNGHVPVTAIVSAAAVVAAVAGGHDVVAMSNERSADQANLVLDGQAVNHQWSKTTAFEDAFAALVRDVVDPSLTYCSFLRPASEVAIARRFAALERYDTVFNSCNRAFHLRGATTEWCGDCPKCHFVFLVLAPFMGRDRLLAIFGRDLLDDPALVTSYAELCGLTAHKPFECVGEVEESRAAMACLAAGTWRDHAVVRALGDRLPAGCGDLDAHLAPRDAGRLPASLQAPFAATFGTPS